MLIWSVKQQKSLKLDWLLPDNTRIWPVVDPYTLPSPYQHRYPADFFFFFLNMLPCSIKGTNLAWGAAWTLLYATSRGSVTCMPRRRQVLVEKMCEFWFVFSVRPNTAVVLLEEKQILWHDLNSSIVVQCVQCVNDSVCALFNQTTVLLQLILYPIILSWYSSISQSSSEFFCVSSSTCCCRKH